MKFTVRTKKTITTFFLKMGKIAPSNLLAAHGAVFFVVKTP
jgi:hypothetical protein